MTLKVNAIAPPKRLLATLAAALAAMVVAAPVWAQTTGTIEVGFPSPTPVSISTTATLNDSREWVLSYSVSTQQVIDAWANNSLLNVEHVIPPYMVEYYEIGDRGAFAGGGTCWNRNIQTLGHKMTVPSVSWQQSLRAKPDRTYCLAIYSMVPEAGNFWGKSDKDAAVTYNWFRTPADPNPPASPAWMPNPFNTGCGTETTLALVRQCFQCKGGGGSWSMSANTCGN